MTTSTSTQTATAARADIEINFLDEGSQEWDRAWSEIARRYGDTACECPATGEMWQYMGTVERAGHLVHEFRHRNLPARNARVYDQVVASFGWLPDLAH
jgi:hypothetical protein